MKIDITKHYFRDNAKGGEVQKYGDFQVGEIVADWYGETGCILMLFKNGSVRTDSNGMGEVSQLKKLRSKSKILKYMQDLFATDLYFMRSNHEYELAQI